MILLIFCGFLQMRTFVGAQTLTSKQLIEDVRILRQELDKTHPGIYAYYPKTKFDSLFQQIEGSLKSTGQPIDLYRKLLPLHTLIANNHTGINCPKSYVDKLKGDLPRLPIQLYIRNGKSYLRQDASSEKSIPLGSEILKINGVEMSTLIHSMLDFESTDGHNKSLPLFVIGYAFSRKYAQYFGTPDSFEIAYMNSKKEKVIVNLKALSYEEIRQNQPPPLARDLDIKSQPINEMYCLKVPTFQPEKAGQFRKTIKDFFRTLQKEKTQKLIIDLRGNGGGYGEATHYLLSYLIDKPVYPYKKEYAIVGSISKDSYYKQDMFFKHFNRQNLKLISDTFFVKSVEKIKIKPKKYAFNGDLIILMDARSASATGEFLGLLKSYTNALFIGEEAGGNPHEFTASDLLTLVLPNSKIEVTIPVIRTIMNTTFPNNGHGVKPDIELIPTLEEVLEGDDPVLRMAKEKE